MTCDYTQLANNGVQQLRPYQPGKPVEELQRELGLRDVVKLASNENPLGPSHRALEAARRSLDQIHLYPDGAGFELKHALADNLGVSSDRITLGNGSNDVLELVARAYLQPGDEAVFSEYAFAIYPLVTLGCSAKPVSVDSHLYGHDLAAMADAITERTRVVFLANPNNPTGTWFNDQALDNFLARVPERVIVVLDEAYFEYVEESHYPDGLKRLDRYPNLVVTRTFSRSTAWPACAWATPYRTRRSPMCSTGCASPSTSIFRRWRRPRRPWATLTISRTPRARTPPAWCSWRKGSTPSASRRFLRWPISSPSTVAATPRRSTRGCCAKG